MNLKIQIVLLLTFGLLIDSVAQRKSKRETVVDDVVPTEQRLLKAETTFIDAEKHILLENYAKAYELLLAAKELNPTNATIYYKLAEVTLKNGSSESAIEHVSKAISLDPDNKYFYILKADILKSLGQYDEAAEVYETLVKRLKGNEEYLFELAAIYQYLNKYDQSLAAYKKAEDHFGLSEAILLEKQKIYFRTNDMKSLLADWDRLIQENPNNTRYLLELGTLLIANGMNDEASKRLKILYEKDKENSGAALLMAEIEMANDNYDQALEYLQIGILSENVQLISKIQLINNFLSSLDNNESNEKLITAVSTLAEKYSDKFEAIAFAGDVHNQLGDKNKALEYYRKSITLSKPNFTVWQQVVVIEFELLQYDSVIVHCDKALEYFPNQSIFYFYNGVALTINKDFRKAIQVLEQGKKYTQDPKLISMFYGQLGDAYNNQQDYEKSDAAYEKALAHDDQNDQVLNNFSYYLSLRGTKLEKASKMSKKLITKYPDNATYLDTYGWVQYVMSNYDEAEKYLKKAVGLEEDGTILEHYGDVLFKLGLEDEALIHWKKAKEIGGTSEMIENKIEQKKIYE